VAKEKNFTRGPRIRSGGQTGVDRAALDAAVLTGRPYDQGLDARRWLAPCAAPLSIYPTFNEREAASNATAIVVKIAQRSGSSMFSPARKSNAAPNGKPRAFSSANGPSFTLPRSIIRAAVNNCNSGRRPSMISIARHPLNEPPAAKPSGREDSVSATAFKLGETRQPLKRTTMKWTRLEV
jgi:Circularly permutated YpsA SLOG family